MSGMKRAADAAPRFQERLKTQITRSTAVLLTAFLLLFGVLLAIYSEGYTYYENREYNRQLTEAFRDTYLSCADYLRQHGGHGVLPHGRDHRAEHVLSVPPLQLLLPPGQ